MNKNSKQDNGSNSKQDSEIFNKSEDILKQD